MAYTYDEFLKAANDAGVMDRFSTDDLTAAQKNPEYGISMVGLLGDISKATTTEQRLLATEAANQLRKNYGVYGTGESYAGSFGTQIGQTMDKLQNYGAFQYGQEDAYKQLLESVANPGSFSYDPASDPSFQAYRKAYLREGERASANALAQASAASGGVPSSFAVSAAQQAGNYYAGQVADMIPTLEQNAYQRFLNDYNSKLSGLGALQNDRAQAQEEWLNQYNILQNNLGNLQSQDATDYERYLDQQAQAQQKYENALTLYQLLGYATPEVAQILGLETKSGGTDSSNKKYTGNPQDLPNDTGGDGQTLVNYEVTNENNELWCKVGQNKLTWPTIERLVNEGKIVESVNQNTGEIHYDYATTQTTSGTKRKGELEKSVDMTY